jgi:predicted TIM-barrel enzyme
MSRFRIQTAVLCSVLIGVVPGALVRGLAAEPEDAAHVLGRTEGIVGFFGASSAERLPTERAVRDQVRRFKSIQTRAEPAPAQDDGAR